MIIIGYPELKDYIVPKSTGLLEIKPSELDKKRYEEVSSFINKLKEAHEKTKQSTLRFKLRCYS